jgi:hypothetical protein
MHSPLHVVSFVLHLNVKFCTQKIRSHFSIFNSLRLSAIVHFYDQNSGDCTIDVCDQKWSSRFQILVSEGNVIVKSFCETLRFFLGQESKNAGHRLSSLLNLFGRSPSPCPDLAFSNSDRSGSSRRSAFAQIHPQENPRKFIDDRQRFQTR